MKAQFLAALVLFPGFGSSTVVAQMPCPQTASDWQQCEKLVEKRLLKKFPRLFHRDGQKLVLRFSDVSPETFVDGETVKGYESSYAVSMKTSLHINILDTPVFSPDEMHFGVGREDGFGLNSFAVYRVGREEVIREYFEQSATWVAQDVRWRDNATVSFVETGAPSKTLRIFRKRAGTNTTVSWDEASTTGRQ